MLLKVNMNDKIVDQKIYYLFFMKEGDTMKEIIDNQKCEFTMSKLK